VKSDQFVVPVSYLFYLFI